MKRARNKDAKENRKQDILDSAKGIVQENGLANLSISTVAKKTGLAVGTIYLYFKKKEDIIAELTIEARNELLKRFRESVVQETTALAKIKAFLTAYLVFFQKNPYYYELVSFYENNTGLQESELLLQSSSNITNFVMHIIEEGKQQNDIRHDLEEKEFSFLLWGATNGIIQLINVKSTILSTQLNKSTEYFFDSFIGLIIKSISQ